MIKKFPVPILIDVIGRYTFSKFKQDLSSGFIVAIVSFPITISFAVYCGANPSHGVFSAVLGGFIAALFGGTRHIVTAPPTIFLLTMIEIVRVFGFEGLYLATFMAGIILILASLVKVNRFIDFVPYSVVARIHSQSFNHYIYNAAKRLFGAYGYFKNWYQLHAPAYSVLALLF